MRQMSRVNAFLAAGILIAIPGSKSSEATTASQPAQKESALCVSRRNSPVAALMSFAGYRRMALGFPWEGISTPGLGIGNQGSAPVIFGLPETFGPVRSRAPLAQTVDVIITNNYFTPATVRISVGDTVRWTWQAFPHSVTSGQCLSDQYEDCTVDNKFCSPSNVNCVAGQPSGLGFVYSHQFNIAGTYPYFCNQHFGLMNGTIIVEGSVSPTIQFSGKFQRRRRRWRRQHHSVSLWSSNECSGSRFCNQRHRRVE